MRDLLLDLQHQFEQSFLGEHNDRWLLYLKGLEVAIIVTIGALAIGIVLGIIIAMIRTSYEQAKKPPFWLRSINKIAKIYVTVIRGTPMMVQLLIMYFIVFEESRNMTLVAIIAFGMNSGAYVAEIIRSGIQSIHPGQMEAGRSLGMKYGTIMKRVIIPQAIKNILPALGNEMITLFKDTSIVTVIGLVDLTKVAIQIQARTYQKFMPFIGIALVYLVCVLFLTWALEKFERRLRASDRS